MGTVDWVSIKKKQAVYDKAKRDYERKQRERNLKKIKGEAYEMPDSPEKNKVISNLNRLIQENYNEQAEAGQRQSSQTTTYHRDLEGNVMLQVADTIPEKRLQAIKEAIAPTPEPDGAEIFTKYSIDEQNNPRSYLVPEKFRIKTISRGSTVVGVQDPVSRQSYYVKPATEERIRREEQKRVGSSIIESEMQSRSRQDRLATLEKRLIYEGRNALTNAEYKEVLEYQAGGSLPIMHAATKKDLQFTGDTLFGKELPMPLRYFEADLNKEIGTEQVRMTREKMYTGTGLFSGNKPSVYETGLQAIATPIRLVNRPLTSAKILVSTIILRKPFSAFGGSLFTGTQVAGGLLAGGMAIGVAQDVKEGGTGSQALGEAAFFSSVIVGGKLYEMARQKKFSFTKEKSSTNRVITEDAVYDRTKATLKGQYGKDKLVFDVDAKQIYRRGKSGVVRLSGEADVRSFMEKSVKVKMTPEQFAEYLAKKGELEYFPRAKPGTMYESMDFTKFREGDVLRGDFRVVRNTRTGRITPRILIGDYVPEAERSFVLRHELEHYMMYKNKVPSFLNNDWVADQLATLRKSYSVSSVQRLELPQQRFTFKGVGTGSETGFDLITKLKDSNLLLKQRTLELVKSPQVFQEIGVSGSMKKGGSLPDFRVEQVFGGRSVEAARIDYVASEKPVSEQILLGRRSTLSKSLFVKEYNVPEFDFPSPFGNGKAYPSSTTGSDFGIGKSGSLRLGLFSKGTLRLSSVPTTENIVKQAISSMFSGKPATITPIVQVASSPEAKVFTRFAEKPMLRPAEVPKTRVLPKATPASQKTALPQLPAFEAVPEEKPTVQEPVTRPLSRVVPRSRPSGRPQAKPIVEPVIIVTPEIKPVSEPVTRPITPGKPTGKPKEPLVQMPPLPIFKIPKVPSLSFPAAKKGKMGFGTKARTVYRPSIVGIIGKYRMPKQKRVVLTGFEVRGI